MKKISMIALSLIVLTAVILNFLPRLNYQYPLHVDEYVHWQYANNLSSQATLYFGQEYKSLEEGFHILLAVSNSIGVPYIFLFWFFPSLFLVLICLSVFVLTRRLFNETAAFFAVLFIALLKSSAAILGPVFLVPLNIGLLLIPVGLWMAELSSGLYLILFSALLIIHPPSGLAFFLLISIEIFMKKENIVQKFALLIAGGAIALPLYIDIFLKKGAESLEYLSFNVISSPLFIPRFLGYFSTAVVLLGIYFSIIRKKYSLAVYSIALLFFVFLFYRLKVEFFIPYARVLMYLFLVFAIAFGAGCSGLIEKWKNPRLKILIIFFLVIATLFFSLPAKFESNSYIYHIIDGKDYDDFIWIKEHSDKNAIAVLDSWKANAFTPIAERKVYSRVVQGPSEEYEMRNKEIENFFSGKCENSSFLEQNNISIVYGECSFSVNNSQDSSIMIKPPKQEIT